MRGITSSRKWVAQAAVAAAVMSLAGVASAPPAVANVVANNAPSSYTGEGFDIYTAQPTSKMRAWLGSPYRAVGGYVGGVNRYDPVQPNLTDSWVRTLSAAGWRIIPTYVGLQAPCTTSGKKHLIDPSKAAAQGRGNAYDAITKMKALGLGPHNPVYLDMEAFDYNNATCVKAVSAFFDGWTYRLHSYGYLSGIYGSTGSTIKLLVSQYNSASHRRPDDIWYARYDQRDATLGEPTIPDSYWPHHRIHQYHSNVKQTYNGISLTVDKNAIDGDVADPSLATSPRTYVVSGTQGSPGLTERGAPSTSAPPVGVFTEGSSLSIKCQTTGDAVYGDTVWDQLSDGGYVSDIYTTTPGGDTWAGTVPRCDGTPAGHLDNPPNNVTVEAGRALPVGGWFTTGATAPAALTGVTFSVSTGGGTWSAVGTDSHGGNGHYQVTWSPAWTNGTPVQLRAAATNGVATGTSNVRTGIRVVDTTPPHVTPVRPPLAVLTRYARIAWSATDAGAGVRSYDVRYRKASYAGGFGRWAYPSSWTGTTANHKWLRVAPGYDYCFQVRARDKLGNLSRWSSQRCVARALDDRSLSTATSGWVRRSGSGFYLNTFTATKHHGRVLARTGARLVRVGVVATTCANCGVVRVYVNGRYVGHASLVSSTVHRQQILMLPRFSYRTGKVTVRTVSSGKAVQIDGLVVSRT